MEATTLGKSIIVPSVLELAKDRKLVTVPHRYDHHSSQHGNQQLDIHNDLELEMPIIDMEGLINEDAEELKKLHLACQDWGFFQLLNHGVSSSLLEKIKVETNDFFDLPIEEKKKFWQRTDEIEGFGQAFVHSEDQKLDWADMFYLSTFPKHDRKPHLFPMLPSHLRDTLEDYSTVTRKLAIEIIECIAKNLGINSLRNVFGEGQQMMRMNYYPACPEPEKVIGLTPHSDAVGLTILLQLNAIDGIQIVKHGKWVLVKSKPNAFIINVGDILEILSNGVYRSVTHRAMVNATKERLSIGSFYSPSLTNEIGPMPQLITAQTPQKFRRITMVDYWKGFFVRPLDSKSYLDVMRIDDQ